MVVNNIEILSRYGKIVFDKHSNHNRRLSKCLCLLCGKVFFARYDSIMRGSVKSCGCLVGEHHKMSNTKFYKMYHKMLSRCYRESDTKYRIYGARGITVCDRWKDSFLAFKEDMYESYLDHCEKFGEKNTSIDRIDVNGNYEPSNCKWATNIEQANNKRNNHYITIDNETHTMKEWSKISGIQYSTIQKRIYKYGWNDVDAITIGDGRIEKQRSN